VVRRWGWVGWVVSSTQVLIRWRTWRARSLLLTVVGPRSRKVRQFILWLVALLLLGMILVGGRWVGGCGWAGVRLWCR